MAKCHLLRMPLTSDQLQLLTPFFGFILIKFGATMYEYTHIYTFGKHVPSISNSSTLLLRYFYVTLILPPLRCSVRCCCVARHYSDVLLSISRVVTSEHQTRGVWLNVYICACTLVLETFRCRNEVQSGSKTKIRPSRCHGDLVPPIIWYPGVPNRLLIRYPGVPNHRAAYNIHGEMVPPGEMVLPFTM